MEVHHPLAHTDTCLLNDHGEYDYDAYGDGDNDSDDYSDDNSLEDMWYFSNIYIRINSDLNIFFSLKDYSSPVALL
jgi:hypothetical protein